jgi:hypothetical protein
VPEEYAFILPFTEVASVGGRYDDESFVAGFQIGRIYQELSNPKKTVTKVLIYEDLVEQLDLIAMHYKMVITVVSIDDGIALIHIEKQGSEYDT